MAGESNTGLVPLIPGIRSGSKSAVLLDYLEKMGPLPIIVRRVLRRILPLDTYLHYFGRHDRGTRKIWSQLAGMVQEKRAILDIGAHVGEFSVLAWVANSESPIFAFEPNPESFEILLRAGKENRFVPVSVAVSDTDGEVAFHCAAVTGHLARENQGTLTSEEVETVESVRLDTWAREANVRVGLVKIDVEKAEPRVLRGMQTLLRDDSPIIVCEVLSDTVGKQIQECLPADYIYFAIDENRGLQPSDTIGRNGWRHLNWLFLPKQMSERVLSLLVK